MKLTTSEESAEQGVSSGQKETCANVAADAARKATRETLDALDQTRELNSVTIQKALAVGQRIAAAVPEAVKTEPTKIVRGRVGCLRLLSAGEEIIIGPTTGTETLATAHDVFNWIDGDFKNWGCDKAEQPTVRTPAEVYELAENADYRTIFGSFGQNPDRLCFTTPQIKRFLSDHADKWLREDGVAYFLFLFKVKAEKKGEKDEFFGAGVNRNADGYRGAGVYRFADGLVWGAEDRYRVVVPQL